MLFSFKGRISRKAYAFVAVPIALVFLLRGPVMDGVLRLSAAIAPHGYWAPMAGFIVLSLLLLTPLIWAASVKRLRDIGWPVFLAVSYVLIPLYIIGTALIATPHVIASGRPESSLALTTLSAMYRGVLVYTGGLTLILLFFPGRVRANIEVFSDNAKTGAREA